MDGNDLTIMCSLYELVQNVYGFHRNDVVATMVLVGSRNARYYVKVRIKSSLCLNKHHAMKTYGGVEVELRTFLISALVKVSGRSASRSSRFILMKWPGSSLGTPQIQSGRGGEGTRDSAPETKGDGTAISDSFAGDTYKAMCTCQMLSGGRPIWTAIVLQLIFMVRLSPSKMM
jgi:hypothetical protein